jgi:hypothetical protein
MKLTTGARKALPKTDFAVPGKRAYPIPDKGHAKAALGRADEFGTPAIKAEVKAKVRSKFPGMDDHNPPTSHDEFHKLGR